MTTREIVEGFAYESSDIPEGMTIDEYRRDRASAKRASKDWSRGKAGISALVRWAESIESIRADMRGKGLL